MNSKTEKPEAEDAKKITVSIQANGFPFSLFKEWDLDCKTKYGDCRWMKMWNDHLSAVGGRITDEMLIKIALLEQKVVELEAGPHKIEESKPLTFGDKQKEN